MPYIYRYINLKDEETVYVGKVTTYYDQDATCPYDGLVKRHEQHQRETWYKDIGDENLLLQYIQLSSHTDADIYETWLIQYYDTGQLFNKAKKGWGSSEIDFSPAIFGKWRNFRKNNYKNAEEIQKAVHEMVDTFMRYTSYLELDIELNLKLLCDQIRKMKSDKDKCDRITRLEAQGDFKRPFKENLEINEAEAREE